MIKVDDIMYLTSILGTRTLQKDGIVTASDHLPSTRDWSYAKGSHSGPQYTDWFAACYWWYHHHEWGNVLAKFINKWLLAEFINEWLFM